MRRLSPGDHFVGDAAAEITVLRDLADKVLVSHARTELLKAVSVLRDRSGLLIDLPGRPLWGGLFFGTMYAISDANSRCVSLATSYN